MKKLPLVQKRFAVFFFAFLFACVLNQKIEAQTIMFDDFNYTGIADPQLPVFNKWVIIDGINSPSSGSQYSKNNVAFIADPDNANNKIITLKTTANGQTKAITNARIETNGFDYFEGTYAARILLSDEGFNSKDANIQTFYTIVNSTLAEDGSKYSELDVIEYFAADRWGTSANNQVGYTTSYHKYSPSQDKRWEAHTTQKKSLAGWHTFVATCTDGVNIRYYMDNTLFATHSVTGNEIQAGLSVYPRSNMQIAFANWIWSRLLGTGTNNRTNTFSADWVLYYKNKSLTPIEVNNLVNDYRVQGLVRRNLAGQTVLGTVNPPPSGTGLVTAYADCPYAGFSVALEPGDYNEARLKNLGIAADKISSIRVAQGYEVILYDLDNFAGPSVITGTNGCLDAVGFSDKTASLRVRTKGTTTITGTYFLQNRSSNLYMDVQGGTGATQDGANIQQWNTAGTTNQQFTFTHLGDGAYKIAAVHSGKVIDVSGISKANGANVFQYTYFGSANQQFIMVPTNNGYYKLIAKHSGKVVEVAGCSGAIEANVQQWDNNNQLCSEWKLVPVTTTNPGFTKLIQAEDYSLMKGIQTEPTTDVGGGKNVGYTDATDYMVYNSITFSTTGAYLIEYRVASIVTTAQISSDLNAGATQLGANLNIPNTGGWQNWATISQTVNINAGTHNFGLYIVSGGVNINWIKITKVNAAAAVLATASTGARDVITNDRQSGVTIYPNPAGNTLTFSTQMGGAAIKILNHSGQSVVVQKVNRNNSIDVSGLKTGIYFVVFDKDGTKTTKRFVKK